MSNSKRVPIGVAMFCKDTGEAFTVTDSTSAFVYYEGRSGSGYIAASQVHKEFLIEGANDGSERIGRNAQGAEIDHTTGIDSLCGGQSDGYHALSHLHGPLVQEMESWPQIGVLIKGALFWLGVIFVTIVLGVVYIINHPDPPKPIEPHCGSCRIKGSK